MTSTPHTLTEAERQRVDLIYSVACEAATLHDESWAKLGPNHEDLLHYAQMACENCEVTLTTGSTDASKSKIAVEDVQVAAQLAWWLQEGPGHWKARQEMHPTKALEAATSEANTFWTAPESKKETPDPLIDGITQKVTYHKCKCGDPICKMFRLDHSHADGLLSEADAKLYSFAPRLLQLAFKALLGPRSEVIDEAHALLTEGGYINA